MVQNKVLNYLGLAQKANKIVSGAEAVLDAISNQKVYLVFVANDASSGTFDKISNKCHFYHIPLMNKFTTEELSQAIGKEGRRLVGVTDHDFIDVMMKEIERGDLYEG